jgi:hypothetical protein
MKTLIAIAGCHANEHKADAQRATWVKDVQGADVRFFAGGQGFNRKSDAVWLNCPDDYDHRLEKVLAIFDWALTQGYDYCWKVDDDVYVRPERLLSLKQHHVQGHVMPHKVLAPLGIGTVLGACAGFSSYAMGLVLRKPLPPLHHRFEDVFVTLTLLKHGVTPVQLRPVLPWTHKRGNEFRWNMNALPHPSNNIVASFEYTPEQMLAIHQAFER